MIPQRSTPVRYACRFLVLLLVPVLAVLTPTGAHAATYGNAVSGTLHSDGRDWDPADGYTCAYKVVGSTGQASGPGATTVSTANGSVSCTPDRFVVDAVRVTSIRFTGSSCTSAAVTGADVRSFTAVVTGTVPCGLTSICLATSVINHLVGDRTEAESCYPLTTAAAVPADTPTKGGGCDYGTVTQPTVGAQVALGYDDGKRGTGPYKSSDAYGGYSQYAKGTVTPTSAQQDAWVLYVVTKSKADGQVAGITYYPPPSNSATIGGTATGDIRPPAGTTGTVETSVRTGPLGERTLPAANTEIIGVGFFNRQHAPGGYAVPGGGSTAGLVGITEPARCWFYWGAKIAERPDTTTDDPIGPLATSTGGTSEAPDTTVTPPPSDSNCQGFSATDPSTWAGAAMCRLLGAITQVVSILGNIVGSLGRLATDIAAAIMTGLGSLLRTLFVPSNGFVDSQVGSMRETLASSSPGQWVTLGGGLVPTSVADGGCAGPTLTFPIYKQSISFEPFSACGFMAPIAALVKALITAQLVIFGALGCVRGITSGLGFDFRPGSGAQSS